MLEPVVPRTSGRRRYQAYEIHGAATALPRQGDRLADADVNSAPRLPKSDAMFSKIHPPHTCAGILSFGG
jgi:hypothetical protein